MPEKDVRHLERTLGIDRPALPAYFQQKGVDLAHEPFEVSVSEISSVRAGALFRGNGVHIDAECASTIPGIFAAGDCSTMGAGVAGAAVLGQVAGEEAARYALLQAQPKSIPAQEQNRVQDTLFQPLREKDGVRFHQFEDEIREIVTNFIGYRREEARLQEALRRLRRLRTKENTLTADDYHGLMRVNEARNIRAVAESLAISAIERRETRGGAAHVRVDYPEMDDETGRRIIMVEQVAGELQVSSRATEIPNAVFPEAQV